MKVRGSLDVSYHQRATSDLFNGEDRNPRSQEVFGAVDCGQEPGQQITETNTLKDGGRIVCDEVDTRTKFSLCLSNETRPTYPEIC